MIPIAKPLLGKEEEQAILEVIASGQLVQGPKVQEFEERFAELCGTKYAVATSSGTTALHIAVLAHDIGPSDEVITSPFSFVASANCVLYTGARPVFVDIEPDFFGIDPTKIEKQITKNTKAIIPVHLYGQPCDMDAIVNIAQKHGLSIIEDACQAHGALYRGKPMGSFGTACFSLYATKNITTIEGGMIVTNDAQIAEKARLLRSHGSSQVYHHVTLGFNMRMVDLTAAIGIVQMKKLNEWNLIRQSNAKYLTDRLLAIKGVETPKVREHVNHVYHQYTVRIKNRDVVAQKLKDKGVGVGVHYPIPIHKQPLYQQLGYNDNLPVAETASAEVLSLPVHPSVTESDIDYIVNTIREVLK